MEDVQDGWSEQRSSLRKSYTDRLSGIGESIAGRFSEIGGSLHAATGRIKASLQRASHFHAKPEEAANESKASRDSETNLFAGSSAIKELMAAYGPAGPQSTATKFQEKQRQRQQQQKRKAKGKATGSRTRLSGKARKKQVDDAEEEVDQPLTSAELFASVEVKRAAMEKAAEEHHSRPGSSTATEAQIEGSICSNVDDLVRVLGVRLIQESKTALDVMREWDLSNDGALSQIELRRAIRNIMSIKADNACIDALFMRLDRDRSGKVDIKEIQTTLAGYRKEAERARQAQADAQETFDMVCANVAAAHEAAVATLAAEEAEAALARALDESALSVGSKIAMMLSRTNAKVEPLVQSWAAGRRSPVAVGQAISRSEFRRRAVEFVCAGRLFTVQASRAELNEYYDELQTTTGSSPLDLKLAARAVIEHATRLAAERASLEREAEELKRRAMELQSAATQADAAIAEHKARQQREANDAIAAALEKQREAREARDAKQAARAAEKAREEEEFRQRIARKREKGAGGFRKPAVV